MKTQHSKKKKKKKKKKSNKEITANISPNLGKEKDI